MVFTVSGGTMGEGITVILQEFVVASLLVSAAADLLLLIPGISSIGGDRPRIAIFVEASGGGGGSGSSISNVGIVIAVTAMAGLAIVATLAYSRRGSQSPWSRRRRKQVLLAKQWKSLFDLDGKLCDGGVTFLKKARSGGVEPCIRAEVWPYLLGMYSVRSSKKERETVRSQKRKEYNELRRQSRQSSEQVARSFKLKETYGNNSDDDDIDVSQVFDSPGLEEVTRARPSLSVERVSSSGEVEDNVNLLTSRELVAEEKDEGAITEDNVSDPDTDSNDSYSSENSEEMKPLFGSTKTEDNHLIKPSYSTLDNSETSCASCKAEDFSTWQRIMRLDAIRANAEWVIYSPVQASVSEVKALRLAESVGLKDYDHLEPCRIYHAARLVTILEAYALYDPEIGYCQGMSDLLSPIISVLEEDYIAFWCFVGFMRKARHNFRLDEVGIWRQLNIVSKIIKCKDSHLYKFLEKLQAEDCFFVYRMVVVLFRRELTFEQTLCLWEVMWADQAAIRARVAKSTWGRMRLRAPPTDDLLLYAIAACVLQKRKLILEKYSSMDEIMRECNSMAGCMDIWKLLDDAHDLVATLHDKI